MIDLEVRTTGHSLRVSSLVCHRAFALMLSCVLMSLGCARLSFLRGWLGLYWGSRRTPRCELSAEGNAAGSGCLVPDKKPLFAILILSLFFIVNVRVAGVTEGDEIVLGIRSSVASEDV